MMRAVQHRGFAVSSLTAKTARGGACIVPHLLIPAKSCVAFISHSSELARVQVVQQYFVPLRQIRRYRVPYLLAPPILRARASSWRAACAAFFKSLRCSVNPFEVSLRFWYSGDMFSVSQARMKIVIHEDTSCSALQIGCWMQAQRMCVLPKT